MTSVFSWQNSVSLWPASFCTPRPKLPVTPGISWLPTFAFQSPIMKMTSFGGVSSRRSCRSSQNHSTSAPSALLLRASDLDYYDIEWFHWKWSEIILLVLRFHPTTAFRGFPGGWDGKDLPTVRETWVWSLGQEDPLEKEMETHSSTLAWKIPWMEEHGRLQSMGPQRVEQDWATSLSLHFRLFYWLWWLLHFF